MKRLLAILMATVMVLALAACGGNNSTASSTPPASQDTQTTEPDTTPTVDYPTKNITIYLGNKAGSTVDITTRTAASVITSQHPEFNFVIENRPGGANDLGWEEMMLQPNDGYAIMGASNTNFSGTVLKDTDFSLDSVKPIACMSGDYGVFIVPADSPYETMNDLIEAAKTQELTLSTSSISTTHSVYAHVLADKAGLNFNFVYNDGSGDSVMMVASGDADCGTSGFTTVKAMYEEGLIRILCQVSPERLPNLPADIPTLTECGYDVSYGTHRCLWAPADMPDDIYQILVDLCAEVFNTQEYMDTMNDVGSIPRYLGPDDLLEAAKTDIAYATEYYDLLAG